MYLETERLTIRRMESGDLGDFLRYAMEPERCRMMGRPPYRDAEEAAASFEWTLCREKRFYAIVLREESRCVGHVIVQNNPCVSGLPELYGKLGRSLSFCVGEEYRRRGIAEEALRAVIGYLFEQRDVDYVHSGYFPVNEPSRAIHEKLGFNYLTESAVNLPGGIVARTVETVLWNPRRPGNGDFGDQNAP